MTEIKTSYLNQTSIDFNDLNSPINLKLSFIQPDGIKSLIYANDIIKKNSIEKHTKQKLRQYYIKTKSENFFKEYKYGVPRFFEFSPKYSYPTVNKFLNEKIIDKNTSSIKFKKEDTFDNYNLCFDNKNKSKYKTNSLNKYLLSHKNFRNTDNFKSFFSKYQNDPKLEENNKEFKGKNIQLKYNFLDNKNNNFVQANTKNSNKTITRGNLDFKKSLNSDNDSNNLINNLSICKNKVKSNNIGHNSILNIINSNKNYFHQKLAVKDSVTNNSFKNSSDFTNEISSAYLNTNNKPQNIGNEINEYEDILEDKYNRKNINFHCENSNDFSLYEKKKDDITNITHKNFNTSFSKDYNITFLKKQYEQEKNIAYEINRLKLGSDIPQTSKEFYLLNFNEALEKGKIKNKEKIIQQKNSTSKQIKKSTQTNLDSLFKKTNHVDYLRFEKDFNQKLSKNKSIIDTNKNIKNFNYNFNSEKYSCCMQINSYLNFPTIINDPQNFEEILNKNTNKILERARKLSNK